MLKRSQPRWPGHVCYMSDKYLPKRLFYSEQKVDKHSKRGQNRTTRTLWRPLWCAVASALTFGRKPSKFIPSGMAWSTQGWPAVKSIESMGSSKSASSGQARNISMSDLPWALMSPCCNTASNHRLDQSAICAMKTSLPTMTLLWSHGYLWHQRMNIIRTMDKQKHGWNL